MPTRIVHFTDLHFTAHPKEIPWSALFSKRLLGWLNLTVLGRYEVFAATATVARAFVEDLERANADHILFTGDVTGLSLDGEFEAARDVLAPLLDDDQPVTGIPGNHDVYVPAADRGRAFERWFGAWVQTDVERHELPEEARPSYPYPLLRLVGDDVAILCLRDSRATNFLDSSGRVDAAQLRALDYLLSRDDVEQRVKILALHYSPRDARGGPDTFLHRLRNAGEVLELAERRDVALSVHGHIHRRFVHAQDTVSSVALANPGSLSFDNRDRAYHVFTIDAGEIRLEARHYDPTTRSFRAWPDAPGCGVVWRR